MIRRGLSDAQWRRIEKGLPGKDGDRGRSGADNRLFVDAVLWVLRTGSPWRDLPEEFGNWNSVFQRFRPLGNKGRLGKSFQGVRRRPRFRIPYDRRNHRPRSPACGGRKGGSENEAIGRSRGGLSTKINVAVDALGNPLRIILTEGQVHDIRQAEALIEGFACEKVLADKGYDSDKFREVIASKGAEAVIPPKRSRKELIPYDKDVYQDRNLVERFFNKIKNFRRIATRYDKTALSFTAMLALAAAMIWLR